MALKEELKKKKVLSSSLGPVVSGGCVWGGFGVGFLFCLFL